MVITIGRACGSGGLEIAQKLAQRLNIPCYDAQGLLEEAQAAGCADKMQTFLAEKPVNSLLFSIAMENNGRGVGKVPFELMRQLAERQDFVLIGHCGNYALRGRPDLTTFFVHGDLNDRIERIVHTQNKTEREAHHYIQQTDTARRHFHEFYTGEVWGEASKYDLTVNSFALGMDETAALLDWFVRKRNKTAIP